MIARKGESITCVNGHIVGDFREDVANDARIEARDFGVYPSHRTPVGRAGACRYVYQCGEEIAVQNADNGYRVHTKRGWLG